MMGLVSLQEEELIPQSSFPHHVKTQENRLL